jgi:hypothetical protein
VGLCARDFPTERVLSRTPLIIRTVTVVFPPSTEGVLSRTPLIIRTVDQNPKKTHTERKQKESQQNQWPVAAGGNPFTHLDAWLFFHRTNDLVWFFIAE